MRNKVIGMVAASALLCLGGAALIGCGKTETIITPHTEHYFIHVEAKEATSCIDDGWVEHDVCIYCNKTFVDGVEKTDVAVVNPNGHSLRHYDEAYGCFVDGVSEHDACELCKKLFVDGEEVSQESLLIPAANEHTWDESGLTCVYGDAYKLLYNGAYYSIDEKNGVEFTPCVRGSFNSTTDAAEKQKYYDSLFENRMTFFMQNGSGASVTGTGESWVISNTSATATVGNFTRFAYGEGSEGYIGRFLITFEVSVSADVTLDRFGAKIVNSTAGAYTDLNAVWDNTSKLLGTNASEENNPDRKFTPGVNYRFVYEMETTESKQMIQIWTCLKGAATVTVSNLHCIPLEEATGKVDYKLVYFDEASNDNFVVTADECNHELKYGVSERTATCQLGGAIAHEHCSVCGKNFIGGQETSEQVNLPVSDHDYGTLYEEVESSCTVKGHAAYYQCSWCKKYFDTDKKELEAYPEYELTKHDLGDWESNLVGHWKTCSECSQRFEYSEHIPGDAPTETTDQTCTECGWIINVSLSHEHTITLVPQKNASADGDGWIEHYSCSGCHKTFSDENGENELSDVTLKYVASTIAGADSSYNGTTAQVTNPGFLANPGHWVVQTQTSNASASISGGVMNITIGSNAKEKTNKVFVRALPAKEDGTAFVGTYLWSFDFEVTADTTLYVGHFIQHDEGTTCTYLNGGGNVAITDVTKEFKKGVVYRFTLFAETLNANEYVQLNIRNAANHGGSVKISNASFVFYPEHVNTGEYRIESIAFATPVEQEQPAAATVALEAILPDNKSDYAA